MSLLMALAIHNAVNRNVQFVDDARNIDIWQVAKRRGGCEDFALAKRERLIKAGYAPEDIHILLFYDIRTKNGHVVLYLPKEDAVSDIYPRIKLETMAAFKERTNYKLVCETIDFRPINMFAEQRCKRGNSMP